MVLSFLMKKVSTMKNLTKTIGIAFTVASLTLAPLVEAARMGKGGSAGMRRSAPPPAYRTQTAPPAQPPVANQTTPAPGQTQPRQGPGVGTAVAAGAVGAMAGYALGSAMNDNGSANSAPQAQAAPDPAAAQANSEWGQASAQHTKTADTPWGLILILGALFFAGLFWFRRKVAPPLPASAQHAGRPDARGAEPARFEPIPKIGSGAPGYSGQGQAQAYAITRLTDGTETPHFLRQAKATFLHLQSLNSAESVDEVRKYMTTELFQSLRDVIINNKEIADFPTLECQLIESTEEAGRHVASVRFSGMVSESVGDEPIPFNETWHYVKESATQNKWLVAGIQQD